MKMYADLPRRRTAQVVADLAMLAWVVVCTLVGRSLHDAILALTGPGHQLEAAGSSWHTQLTAAADAVGGLPVVGDRVAGPFHTVASAGSNISSAGTSLVSAVENLAVVTGWAAMLLPIVTVALVWGLLRWRFTRRATSMQRFLAAGGSLDTVALRALSNLPMRRLTSLGADPAGAWRAGDPDVIAALAALELRRVGLAMPGERPVLA